MSTDDHIPADQHAEAAREALAASRDGAPDAMLDLQRGTIEALLAIHEQLRGGSDRTSLRSDLELITLLPQDSSARQRLLALAEREIEARLRVRTELTRDVGGVIGGVVLLAGGVGLGVVTVVFLHTSWWVLTLACVLFFLGAAVFGASVGKERRDASGKSVES